MHSMRGDKTSLERILKETVVWLGLTPMPID
jgi:hypothetical protein